MAQSKEVSQRKRKDYLEFLSDMGVESVPRPASTDAQRRAAPRSVDQPVLSPEIPAKTPEVFSPPGKFADEPGASSKKPITPTGSLPADPDLNSIRLDIGDCRRCRLCAQRTNIVFGCGHEKARVMFIGEGPGADEDMQGVPFVGKAGQLLTKIMEAIHFTREQVYIANVVKCRPPGNRTPEPDEIAACQGFLFRQISVIRPWIICALGAPSAQTLLGTKTPIGQLRGKWHPCRGVLLMPTYHPSYLLRNPGAKREVWEDVKFLRSRYEELCQEKGVTP